MGKLTDSLKDTVKQLESLQEGLNTLGELEDHLVENTFVVAEAALRTGYAYAKAESAIEHSSTSPPFSQQPLLADPTLSRPKVLDPEYLPPNEAQWTKASLSERFGTCLAAYRYLKEHYSITLSTRSWDAVIEAFNQDPSSQDPSPESTGSLEKKLNHIDQKLDTVIRALGQITQLLIALTQQDPK